MPVAPEQSAKIAFAFGLFPFRDVFPGGYRFRNFRAHPFRDRFPGESTADPRPMAVGPAENRAAIVIAFFDKQPAEIENVHASGAQE